MVQIACTELLHALSAVHDGVSLAAALPTLHTLQRKDADGAISACQPD